MERKDSLGLLAVLVGAGVLLYREGREMGGVTADPITGTVLIYAGLAVVGVGSVLWLWLAIRPLWVKPDRVRLPRGMRQVSYSKPHQGPRAALQHAAMIRIALDRAEFPIGGLELECDGTPAAAGWMTLSANNVRMWSEGDNNYRVPTPSKIEVWPKKDRPPGSSDVPGRHIALTVYSQEPIGITRIRLRPSR